MYPYGTSVFDRNYWKQREEWTLRTTLWTDDMLAPDLPRSFRNILRIHWNICKLHLLFLTLIWLHIIAVFGYFLRMVIQMLCRGSLSNITNTLFGAPLLWDTFISLFSCPRPNHCNSRMYFFDKMNMLNSVYLGIGNWFTLWCSVLLNLAFVSNFKFGRKKEVCWINTSDYHIHIWWPVRIVFIIIHKIHSINMYFLCYSRNFDTFNIMKTSMEIQANMYNLLCGVNQIIMKFATNVFTLASSTL